MLDHRRVDVARLNQLARQRMWAAGRLGTEALVVGDREFRAGDWVVCGRNAMTAHSGDLGVANGTKGYVTGLDPQRGEPTVRLDQPGEPLEVTLPRWYLAGRLPDGRRALDHAYATTCEKSQGATYDRGFARAGAHATQNWAYVAATRIRDRIDLEDVSGLLALLAGAELERLALFGHDQPYANSCRPSRLRRVLAPR